MMTDQLWAQAHVAMLEGLENEPYVSSYRVARKQPPMEDMGKGLRLERRRAIQNRLDALRSDLWTDKEWVKIHTKGKLNTLKETL